MDRLNTKTFTLYKSNHGCRNYKRQTLHVFLTSRQQKQNDVTLKSLLLNKYMGDRRRLSLLNLIVFLDHWPRLYELGMC